ncbi:60S ribosomal protein L5, partial [Tanacetum coccineum]
HVPDVVDSCRTRKIVEDDRVSTMRKKLTLETEDGATKVGLRLLLIDYGSVLRILVNRQPICSIIMSEEIAIHIGVGTQCQFSTSKSVSAIQRLIINVDNSKFKFRKKRSKPVTEAITSADESGALDGSLDFHHNEKRFLGFSRGTSSLDADVHRKHIYEGHRVDSMSVLLRQRKQEKLMEFDLLRGILGSWLKSLEALITVTDDGVGNVTDVGDENVKMKMMAVIIDISDDGVGDVTGDENVKMKMMAIIIAITDDGVVNVIDVETRTSK